MYNPRGDIHEYLKYVCKKNNLYRFVKLNTRVILQEWIDIERQWKITILDLVTNTKRIEMFDIMINAPGYF